MSQPHNRAGSELTRRRTKLVWTMLFDPFTTDPNPQEVIGCEMVVGDAIPIHTPYRAHLVRSPSGISFVIDEGSGVILGTDWARVKAMVAARNMDQDVYLLHAARGRDLAKTGALLGYQQFWGRLLAI